MNIGQKIKDLRKRRSLTQEQLAECLGVSFQTISKWENGISLPDIALMPVIAGYFGISIDEIFDYNLRDTEMKIGKIRDEAVSYRDSDPDRCREILESGLREYPDNDILLNNLLYVTDYRKNADKAVAIALKLIDTTADDAIRFDALRCLAEIYAQKGDFASAEAALNRIPEIYFSKLSCVARTLKGSKKHEAAEKQKWIAFEDLISMMTILSECYEKEGKQKEAIAEAERALALLNTMNDGHFCEHSRSLRAGIERLKNSLM